jgi:hypothetical protein
MGLDCQLTKVCLWLGVMLTLHKRHSARSGFRSSQSALSTVLGPIFSGQIIPISVNHFELDDGRRIDRSTVG